MLVPMVIVQQQLLPLVYLIVYPILFAQQRMLLALSAELLFMIVTVMVFIMKHCL
jgi:hypothetical protein